MTAPRLLLGKTLPEWARETGIRPTTIRMRIDAWGWSIEEAVGLVPHESLRGKCRGKPVTKSYKKRVDRSLKNDDTRSIETTLWNIWR